MMHDWNNQLVIIPISMIVVGIKSFVWKDQKENFALKSLHPLR